MTDEQRGALVAIVTAILVAPKLAEVPLPGDYAYAEGRETCETRQVIVTQWAMDRAEQIVGDAIEGSLEQAA